MQKQDREFVAQLEALHAAGDIRLTQFTGEPGQVTGAIDELMLSLAVLEPRLSRAVKEDLAAVRVLLRAAADRAEEAGL